MPSPRSQRTKGAPAARARAVPMPPDDAPPIIGERGDTDMKRMANDHPLFRIQRLEGRMIEQSTTRILAAPPRRAEEPSAHRIQSLAHHPVLVATESLGPVNGVTRATEQLLAYLHGCGVPVAAMAPEWQG